MNSNCCLSLNYPQWMQTVFIKPLQCIKRANVSYRPFNGLKDSPVILVMHFQYSALWYWVKSFSLHCSWLHTQLSSVFSNRIGGKWAEKMVCLWVPLWAFANSPCGFYAGLHWTPTGEYTQCPSLCFLGAVQKLSEILNKLNVQITNDITLLEV